MNTPPLPRLLRKDRRDRQDENSISVSIQGNKSAPHRSATSLSPGCRKTPGSSNRTRTDTHPDSNNSPALFFHDRRLSGESIDNTLGLGGVGGVGASSVGGVGGTDVESIRGGNAWETNSEYRLPPQPPSAKWNVQLEKTVKEIGEFSSFYKILHIEVAQNMSKMYKYFSYLGMILGPAAGVVASVSAMFPEEDNILKTVTASLGFLSGISGAIIKFGKYEQTSISHKSAAAKYTSLENNIRRQLSLYREDRLPVREYLDYINDAYDNLFQTSPLISTDLYERFASKAREEGVKVPSQYGTNILINTNKRGDSSSSSDTTSSGSGSGSSRSEKDGDSERKGYIEEKRGRDCGNSSDPGNRGDDEDDERRGNKRRDRLNRLERQGKHSKHSKHSKHTRNKRHAKRHTKHTKHTKHKHTRDSKSWDANTERELDERKGGILRRTGRTLRRTLSRTLNRTLSRDRTQKEDDSAHGNELFRAPNPVSKHSRKHASTPVSRNVSRSRGVVDSNSVDTTLSSFQERSGKRRKSIKDSVQDIVINIDSKSDGEKRDDRDGGESESGRNKRMRSESMDRITREELRRVENGNDISHFSDLGKFSDGAMRYEMRRLLNFSSPRDKT